MLADVILTFVSGSRGGRPVVLEDARVGGGEGHGRPEVGH